MVDNLLEELQGKLVNVPLAAEVSLNRFYSEEEWDVYEVRYNGLNSYRLFAWMSVPKGKGPFPGLIVMPDYGSAVSIPFHLLRFQAVVLNPSYRGQRRSDHTFQASYPGLLTEAIDDPKGYVINSIYADAIRAVDLMVSRPEVDGQPIAITGQGLGGALGIVGAALGSVAALAVGAPLMIGIRQTLDVASGYPLGELKDYLRAYPERRQAKLATWQRHSILPLAKMVQCPVLLALGANDTGQCPLPFGKRLAKALTRPEVRIYEHSGAEAGGHVHTVYQDTWLMERLGLSGAIFPK